MHISQELALEFGRLGLVYVHLIACCVALGLVLKSDVAMVRDMIRPQPSADPEHAANMQELQKIVALALGALWITGAAIVTLDALGKGGWQYFANPKLQAKILVVVILTFNGVVLHNLVLPVLQKAGSLLDMPFSRSMLGIFSGVVSGVSWLYAAMLGVGRPLSWKYSLIEIMAAYPVMIAGGFVSMLMLVTWCKYRDDTPAARGRSAMSVGNSSR
jgi:hypothetical protein